MIAVQLLSTNNAHLLNTNAEAVFDNAIIAEQLDAFIEDPRHLMFIAIDVSGEHELLVGMVSGVEYFHPDKRPEIFINELGVAASHRRRGIGKQLVTAMIEHAKANGVKYAWLGTEADNAAANALYESIDDFQEGQAFLLYEWENE